MRIQAASLAVMAISTTGLAAAPAKKPAPKVAAKPAAALSASAVVAQLRKEEAKVKNGRLTLLTLSRMADLPENTKGAAGARTAVSKAPLNMQRREYLIFSGEDWKRDTTNMDAQGNVTTRMVAGMQSGTGRIFQEKGHAETAERQGAIGMVLPQNAADRVLIGKASDLMEEVKWGSAKPSAAGMVLSGKRGEEAVTVTLGPAPGYAFHKIAVAGSVVTPQGPANRGQEITVTHEGGKVKSVEHLIHITGAVNRASLTLYKVEGAQLNQNLAAQELAIAFPSGTKMSDGRVDPPARYTQGDKDLTIDELKAIAEKQAGNQAKVGAAAPDWELKGTDGKPVKLSDHKGKVVLLTWFASWCGPCHAEAPVMEKEIWQKRKSDGLVVIGVNASEQQDPAKMAAQFIAQHSLTYPVVLDVEGEASNLYKVEALPTIALIDRKGVLRYLKAGFNHEDVVEQLNTLLAEK